MDRNSWLEIAANIKMQAEKALKQSDALIPNKE